MSNQQKTANPTGAGKKPGLRMAFDSRLKLEFHGSNIKSDAGLLAYRELDAALGLTDLGENLLSDGRTGKNTQHSMVAQMRQSIFSRLANSNVADVANSIINMLGTGITIIVILLSPPLAKKFGKKAVAVSGFGLASLGSLAFYFLSPTNVWGMVGLTALIAIAYAPTIPLIWAIYADVADYSEWKTGHRFTGMVFATIGFGLKAGLALGSASFLWIMAGLFNYDTKLPDPAQAVQDYRACSGIVVGILFAICTVLLIAYQLNKKLTIQMADELAFRRSASAGKT
jgi:Na+/melibiose symporter-like transporter